MRRGGTLVRRLGFGLLAMLALVAVGAPAAEAKGGKKLKAKIIRNEQGIPTIQAKNYKSLGFGYGYAFAEDNICTIADTYLTSNAERSKWFGPDEETPEGYQNLESDIFYQRIKDSGIVREVFLSRKTPTTRKVHQVVNGYVKGYNRYLRKTGVDNIPDSRCAGQPWVRPITKMDVYQRFYELLLYASGGIAIDGIANAQPPSPAPRAEVRADAAEAERVTKDEKEGVEKLGAEFEADREQSGSNAWALGSQATKSGNGIVLGNPHFPWDGPRRFYQSHMMIPGKLNVSGASLFGAPVINIGHTRKLAWSHTVSTAFRFVPFELELDPSDPTRYMVDGQSKPMEAHQVTVETTEGPVTRTLYETEYGPITTSIQGQNLFNWTNSTAYAMWDANARNSGLVDHFFEVNHAQSTNELLKILRKHQGIPWVNTIAADSKGRALYADIGSMPNVDNAKVQACNTTFGNITFASVGLPILDGSRSECALTTDPDSAREGILGASKQPFLKRRDYVANSNDSYWLTNPEQPLEGYPRIIGDERTQRTLRTRLGLRMIQQRLAGEDGMKGNKFTRNQVRRLVFQNRHYGGELWADQLAAFCRANPVMQGSGGPVDVSEACPVLEAWDRKVNNDSRGAVLFSRFMDHHGSGGFTHPFDVSDPVNTPFGLDTSDGDVEEALADAVSDLRAANIPLDAAWGDYHTEPRGSEQIPIHGGDGGQGVFNAIFERWTDGDGYRDVLAGSSFVMVAELVGKGKNKCPKDRTILTYSQSESAESEHYADQTRMYSNKEWVNPPFCKREVKRAAESVKTIRGK